MKILLETIDKYSHKIWFWSLDRNKISHLSERTETNRVK